MTRKEYLEFQEEQSLLRNLNKHFNNLNSLINEYPEFKDKTIGEIHKWFDSKIFLHNQKLKKILNVNE